MASKENVNLQSRATLKDDKSFCREINVSKMSVKNLKRIALEGLRLEKVHKGGYLILRTVEKAYKVEGITATVEDHEGCAVLFAAYNLTAVPNPDLDDILPVGTVFILKEPYIEIAGNCDIVLRSDCPSDMIVLYKGHKLFSLAEEIDWKHYIDPRFLVDLVWCHPEPKTALEWKMRGNELYKQNKFEYASRCYLLGLKNLSEISDDGPMVQILQLNLAAAYLQLGYFEKSLEFAEKVLIVEPGNRKAILRAGKSNYMLRKFHDAKQYFDQCHGLYPYDEETSTELQKAKDRCLEQETGKFNIYGMFLSEIEHSRLKHDCADYVGPIKVTAIEGKGRGVVATRNIDPGTLLVVSKALVFARQPEGKFHLQVNNAQSLDFGIRQEVVAELSQLIAKNPNVFGPIVYDLFDGTEQGNKESVALFCDPVTKEEPIVDVQRLSGILTSNALDGVSNVFTSRCPGISKKVDDDAGIGLFAVPSYFNHCCLPNAMYLTFNDVMFVRAIHFIKAGEEIFLPYFDSKLSYSQRQNLCQKRGFHCFCNLCKQDKKLPERIHYMRDSIISKFEALTNQILNEPDMINSVLVQCQLKKLIIEMEKTYKNVESSLMISKLSEMYLVLTTAYSSIAEISPCRKGAFYRVLVEGLHKTLTLFGFCPRTLLASLDKGVNLIPRNAFLGANVFMAICGLILIYQDTFQFELKNKWIKILFALEKIYSGEDINVVKLKYERMIKII